jgi:saccharopine dehydrogenase (NADP+, L-glutamate forming)
MMFSTNIARQFSRSPRGALLSQYNSAVLLRDGEKVEIANKDLMSEAKPYHVQDGYSFVAYPNRNSLPFREFYQIPEAHTVVRGSLRYKGNPALVRTLIDLGWLDTDPKSWLQQGMTWAQIQQQATQAASSSEADLVAKFDELCNFRSSAERDEVVSGLRWIGLFSNEVPVLHGNLLDTLSAQLASLCAFRPGERDLVMLQHKFVVEWRNGSKVSVLPVVACLQGPSQHDNRIPLPLPWNYSAILMAGYSAMSKSVGVTCGIASQLLLDGLPAFNMQGVWAPYTTDICDPIRTRLEAEGTRLVERSSRA